MGASNSFQPHKMVAFDYADFVCYRFVNVLVYYGLSLNISDFGMNIYLTQMIFGLVEMPARTITLFTLNRSRRISQLAFLAVGGLACLLTIFIPDGRWKTKPLLNYSSKITWTLKVPFFTGCYNFVPVIFVLYQSLPD